MFIRPETGCWLAAGHHAHRGPVGNTAAPRARRPPAKPHAMPMRTRRPRYSGSPFGPNSGAQSRSCSSSAGHLRAGRVGQSHQGHQMQGQQWQWQGQGQGQVRFKQAHTTMQIEHSQRRSAHLACTSSSCRRHAHWTALSSRLGQRMSHKGLGFRLGERNAWLGRGAGYTPQRLASARQRPPAPPPAPRRAAHLNASVNFPGSGSLHS